MGNILKCFISYFDGGDEDVFHGRFPSNYPPTSRLHYQHRRLDDLQVPLSPPPRPCRQQQPPPRPARPLGYHHGVPWPTVAITPWDDFINLEFTSKVCEEAQHHSTPCRKKNLNRCIQEKDDGNSKHDYYWLTKSKDNHVITPMTKRSPRPPSGVAALVHDLLDFTVTFEVPEGLAQHVTSPMQAQVTWYRKLLAAYKDIKYPPEESADATVFVAAALRGIERTNLEGFLAFYGFPIPTISKEASENHRSSIPKGVLFVLKTLPVNAKCIVDGDGFTAYVDTLNPIELRGDCNASCQTPNSKKQKLWKKRATDLQISLENTGQKEMFSGGREIVARKYEIRLRGIDAPEMGMQYGKESQDALVKLIARKCVTLHVYGQDQFKRFVCDIHCGGVFIQEQMLVNGHAWHFKNYDKRPQFAKWEKMAQDARQGLWAYDNPVKPWEWRKNKRKASQHHKSGVR
uniref:TNase-like domain-containing protein n=1 Tax=Oryza punctata TaxID=4537 RepID=A0A0E0ML26_ORYPU